MNNVSVKQGVSFLIIKPAGFRILCAIQNACIKLGINAEITSGTDGCHSGDLDPHHTGEAYDVHSHDYNEDQKAVFLKEVMSELGWDKFYGFLESPMTSNEHFHFQRKKGTVYQ